MTSLDYIKALRADYDGLNDPADSTDVSRLKETFGALPKYVINLYRDHDGSPGLPRRAEAWLPARLLPVEEAIETKPWLDKATKKMPHEGEIAFLWTDDNSNYIGISTSGLLEGWLVKLGHEEPTLTPAYRSIGGFLGRLLKSAPGTAGEDDAAYDVMMVPRETPTTLEDPISDSTDRVLAKVFYELYPNDTDPHVRRFHAECAMCLTPVADTAMVIPFLFEKDIWTPELAVKLMAIRGYDKAVADLERLAIEGGTNGDTEAMCLLVRLGTPSSTAAVERLRKRLKKEKLKTLKQWLDLRENVQPPRWD